MVARDRTRLIDRLRLGCAAFAVALVDPLWSASARVQVQVMDAAERSQRFVLRLSPALHRRVTEAAATYRRSMNAEILARLEYSLNGIPADDDVSAVEPAFFPYLETTFRGELSDEENTLIRLFRRLSSGQRAALVDLLGG